MAKQTGLVGEQASWQADRRGTGSGTEEQRERG